MTTKKCNNLITCAICLQLYKNPKILPCQHSYCEECLVKLEKDKKITCPACRNIADVPSNGVEDFNTNFFINYQIDDHILKRKIEGKEEVSCEVCVENDPVMTFCPTCVLFMCQLCDDQHKRSKSTRQHLIISLTDFHTKLQDVEVKPKKQVAICKNHAIDMKFYCETCEELVCLYCTTKAHSTHSHDAVKKVAATYREQLKKTTAPLNDMITRLSQAHDNITDTTESVLQQHKTVDKDIDHFFDDVIQKVEQQRRQLKQELHNKVSGKVKLLTSKLEEVESVQAHVIGVNELASKVEKSDDEISMLSGKRQLVHHVHEVIDTYDKLQTDPTESCVYFFAPFYKSFPQLGYIFDPIPPQCEVSGIPVTVLPGQTVQFTIITKEVRGIPNIRKRGVVKAQLDNGRDNIQSVPVKDNNNGRYTGSFNTELVGHHQLSVTIGGKNIKGSPLSFIVSRDYSKLMKSNKVINDNGKMGKPRGVTVSDDVYWAVTDGSNHRVYIFNEQVKNVRTFGSHGDGVGQFNEPCGVSFDDDNFLYVVDGLNHRVQKFNCNGHYLLQFGKKGSNDNELNLPVGITVHHNKVYIADCGNHRISVYQTDGTYCFSFGSYGKEPSQFQYPWDVAVTPDNTLVVANTYGHCIQSFQFDGTFIFKFGGQINMPSSLTVDRNGFVLVTDCYDHQVLIFDKNYNFIHKFGSRGVGNNRFDQPRSIAVAPNGNVYISDYLNKRIMMC